jgi:hypothetical protein
VVSDGLRILATACKERFLSARIVLEIALIIIEYAARRDVLQVRAYPVEEIPDICRTDLGSTPLYVSGLLDLYAVAPS